MNPLYKLATLVFPERCPYCGCLIEAERIACPSCAEILRQKHIPLNNYVSLNKPLYDEESDRTLLDVIIEGRTSDPEEMIINMENVGNIRAKISEVLSGLEQEVLNAYLDGRSYQEIAESLGRHVKSIDNALQRVKRKLEKYLEENRV